MDPLLDGGVVVLNLTEPQLCETASLFRKRQACLHLLASICCTCVSHLRNLPCGAEETARGACRPDSPGTIRLSEHLVGDAAEIFAKACRLGAEGIISKLSDAKYAGGRGSGWLKLKCGQEQEFVIGGFTHPSNGAYGVGALMLGYYRDGKLIYAGRTGTGFTQKTHQMLVTSSRRFRRATSV
jgi:bifunctional non-homologous end joining protein LigD